MKKTTSIYKGVSLYTRRFAVRVRHNNKTVLVGYYNNEIVAAKEYDQYIKKHKLNRKTNKELGLL